MFCKHVRLLARIKPKHIHILLIQPCQYQSHFSNLNTFDNSSFWGVWQTQALHPALRTSMYTKHKSVQRYKKILKQAENNKNYL